MPKLDKKVERLRAVLYTQKQADTLIKNLKDIGEYSSEDKSLMEAFKRVYHGGISKLKLFIQALEDKGSKVDEYSIFYYTRQLSNSPFWGYIKSAVLGKQYWKSSPDVMGTLGNLNRSTIHTPIATDMNEYRDSVINNSVVTLDKIPQHMLQNSAGLEYITESMYGLSFTGGLQLETYMSGKDWSDRQKKEKEGTFCSTAHGGYLAADTKSWDNIKGVSDGIFKSVQGYLGDEDYRMYLWKKKYNPYTADSNVSTTSNLSVIRILPYEIKNLDTGTNTLTSVEIVTDLTGNTFESVGSRQFEIKIPTQSKDVILKLHTVEGQLGGITEIKKAPISG